MKKNEVKIKLQKPAKLHDGIIFCTIAVVTDRNRVDNEGCYADSRKRVTHSRTEKFDPKGSFCNHEFFIKLNLPILVMLVG